MNTLQVNKKGGKSRAIWISRTIALLLAIFIVWQIILRVRKDSELEKNQIKTTGQLLNYDPTGNGIFLEYRFYVHDKEYINTQVVYKNYFPDCYVSYNCLGLYFEVIYNPEDPENSKIFLDKPIDKKE